MSSSVKFNSFDDRYVHTTEQPTIVAVSSDIAKKKIALIFGAIVVVGVIATVGVILGVVILKKGRSLSKKIIICGRLYR